MGSLSSFAWLLLERVVAPLVWLGLRESALVMLSRKWGVRAHDFVALRSNPGRGDAAARLVVRAPRFEQAAVIFNNCRYAKHVVAADQLHAAIIDRLRTVGPTEATHGFLTDAKIDERCPEYTPTMTDEERRYETMYQYESRVMLFEKQLNESLDR